MRLRRRQPWEVIRDRLLDELKTINNYFYHELFRQIMELADVLDKFNRFQNGIVEIAHHIQSTHAMDPAFKPALDGIRGFIDPNARYGPMGWEYFRDRINDFFNLTRNQIEEIRRGYFRGTMFDSKEHRTKVPKGRVIRIIDDIKNAPDPRALSEVLKIDEKSEIYVIEEMEQNILDLSRWFHKFYVHFYALLSALVDMYGRGDRDFQASGQDSWSQIHRENLQTAKALYHPLSKEFKMVESTLHHNRERIRYECEKTRFELAKLQGNASTRFKAAA